MNFYTESYNPRIMGMASKAQIDRIHQLILAAGNSQPVVSLLKNASRGRASAADELTCAQANEVIRVLGKQ